MNEKEIHLKLSEVKIDNDNLDYIKATGEICGQLRWDLVKIFATSDDTVQLPDTDFHCATCGTGFNDGVCPNCNTNFIDITKKSPQKGEAIIVKLKDNTEIKGCRIGASHEDNKYFCVNPEFVIDAMDIVSWKYEKYL